MDNLLIVVVALAAAGVLWGIIYIVGLATGAQKRKLQQRLSSETRGSGDSQVYRPLVLVSHTTGLPPWLNNLGPIQALQRRVAQGYPDLPLSKFLLIQAGLTIFAVVPVVLFGGSTPGIVVAGLIGTLLPWGVVGWKRGRRQRTISMQLPEAMDFLSRVLRSGQSFSTGLQMMAEELPDPLASEFRRCYDQHSLGQPIEEGLREMALRLGSQDFAFFSTAVVIQRQSGGDLGEVLRNMSHMIRQRLRLSQAVKAKTSEGRFSGYVMVVFPAIMFLLTWAINPRYGGVLLHTSTGHILLGVAGGLELLGLFLIKIITTVKV